MHMTKKEKEEKLKQAVCDAVAALLDANRLKKYKYVSREKLTTLLRRVNGDPVSKQHAMNLSNPESPQRVLFRLVERNLNDFIEIERKMSKWQKEHVDGFGVADSIAEYFKFQAGEEESQPVVTTKVSDLRQICPEEKNAELTPDDEAILSFVKELKAMADLGDGTYNLSLFTPEKRRELCIADHKTPSKWLNNLSVKELISEMIYKKTKIRGQYQCAGIYLESEGSISCSGPVLVEYLSWVSPPLKVRLLEIVNKMVDGARSFRDMIREAVREGLAAGREESAQLIAAKDKEIEKKDKEIEEQVECNATLKANLSLNKHKWLRAKCTTPVGFYTKDVLRRGLINTMAQHVGKNYVMTDAAACKFVDMLAEVTKYLTSWALSAGRGDVSNLVEISDKEALDPVPIVAPGVPPGALGMCTIAMSTEYYDPESPTGSTYHSYYSVNAFGRVLQDLVPYVVWSDSGKKFTAAGCFHWGKITSSGTVMKKEIMYYFEALSKDMRRLKSFIYAWNSQCLALSKVVTTTDPYGNVTKCLYWEQENQDAIKAANAANRKKRDAS